MDRRCRRGRGPPGVADRGHRDDLVAGSRDHDRGGRVRRDADQYVRRRSGRPGCHPRLRGARKRLIAGCPHPALPQRGRVSKAEGAAPMNAGLNLILAASAALFAVGAFAVIARRSAVLMLIGTQFMFVAGCIAFVAFARFGLGAVNATSGAAVAVFAGATAVAELAVGLSMAALIYREHRSLAID